MEKARQTRCGGRLVRYGAKGAKVMPGTPKGDAYCARSLGQMRDHPEAAKDPCSPLRLSRKRWACKGAKSMKTNPATDPRSANTQVANTVGSYRKAGDLLRQFIGEGALVLDFGAGLGLGARELRGAGFDVRSYEPFPDNWRGSEYGPDYVNSGDIQAGLFDAVVSLNVLNVLPRDERREAVREMWTALKPGGVLLLMVRSRQDVEKAKNKRRMGDGWLVSNRGEENFQKGFDFEELKTFVRENLGVADFDKPRGLSGVAILVRKTGMKHNPADDVALPADVILLAPNPTPFGDVVFEETDIKDNLDRKDLYPITDLIRSLDDLSGAAAESGLPKIIAVLKKFGGAALGAGWIRARDNMIAWLEAGMPLPKSGSLGAANKVGVGGGGFSIFAQGNSKLPYLAFSTLPGITCPGAGECLVAAGQKPDPRRRFQGGWCYSFKAWRYPDAFFRQLGNTILLRTDAGRDHLAKVFGIWASTRAKIAGGETVRLYVDGDMDSVETIKFWMDQCKAHPHVRAYGYSKSWHLFLRYDKLGYGWPTNYTLNLSEGSRFASLPGMREEMLKLPIVREDFGVVALPRKIAQNVIRIDRKDPNGVFAAIARLERRVKGTVDEAEQAKLVGIVGEWKDVAKKIENGETIKSVPDEFWSRNPEYTAAVSAEAEKKYGKGGFFVCPGKCGNCLGNGRHACGDLRLKKPIVIGIH